MSGVQKVQRHHFCQKRMAILKASLYRAKAEIDFLHRTHIIDYKFRKPSHKKQTSKRKTNKIK